MVLFFNELLWSRHLVIAKRIKYLYALGAESIVYMQFPLGTEAQKDLEVPVKINHSRLET